jgi:hypothetical protein
VGRGPAARREEPEERAEHRSATSPTGASPRRAAAAAGGNARGGGAGAGVAIGCVRERGNWGKRVNRKRPPGGGGVRRGLVPPASACSALRPSLGGSGDWARSGGRQAGALDGRRFSIFLTFFCVWFGDGGLRLYHHDVVTVLDCCALRLLRARGARPLRVTQQNFSMHHINIFSRISCIFSWLLKTLFFSI